MSVDEPHFFIPSDTIEPDLYFFYSRVIRVSAERRSKLQTNLGFVTSDLEFDENHAHIAQKQYN